MTSPTAVALRLLRLVAWLLLGSLLALTLGAANLWWWGGREGSLATALAWGERAGLQAQGVSGTLRSGGRLDQLSWQASQGGLRVQAQQLQLRWNLSDMVRHAWQGRPAIYLQSVQAELIRLEPGPSVQPSLPPASLQLPMALRADEVALQRLAWAPPGQPLLQATDVAGSYVYDRQQHQLALRQARFAQGNYHGRATLQASGAMALDAEFSAQVQSPVPGSAQVLGLALKARLQGPLQQLDLQASLGSATGPGAARSQAQLTAQLTPWQTPVLPEAQLNVERLNLAALWPQAPTTSLSGSARVQPEGERWRFDTELCNAAAGPWDLGALPVDQLSARGQWQGASVLIQNLEVRLGTGRVQARGSWASADNAQSGWQLNAELSGIDTALIDSRGPVQALQGQVHAEQAGGPEQALRFDAQLSGQPTVQRNAAGWKSLQAQARGQWQVGTLTLDQLTLKSNAAQLQATGQFNVVSNLGQGQGQLSVPGLQMDLRAAWPLTGGAGELDLRAGNVQNALRWLRGLPLLPPSLAAVLDDTRAEGQADVRLAWDSGLDAAQLQARLDLPVLDGPAPNRVALRGLQLSLNGPLAQMQLQAQGRTERGLDSETQRLSAQLSGQVSLPTGALRQALQGSMEQLTWRLALSQLELDFFDPQLGQWTLSPTGPVVLQGDSRSWTAKPGELRLQPPARANAAAALLAWQTLNWQAGELRTTGSLRGLTLGWAELLAGPLLSRAGMAGDMVFDGRWDLQWGQALRVQAEIERRSGDLNLHAETGQGLATRMAANVRDARLSLASDGPALVLGWRWDSERAGQSQGQVRTELLRSSDGSWQWPPNALLSGRLQASLPRLGAWTALAPPGWRLRGSLQTTLSLSGTRSQPLLSGPLAADDLALRSVVDGIELGRGRLRATLKGERLQLDELSLQGPGADGGTVKVTGQASWLQGGPQVSLQAQLNRLRASVRADRLLTVSGLLQAKLQGLPMQRPVEVTGELRVDQARINLPDESRPQLKDDVVVRRPGQAAPAPLAATAHPVAPRPAHPNPLGLAVRLDLGEDFGVEGLGLNAKLRGAVTVTADSLSSAPRLVGSITTASGEYRAYGQRLAIERGLLRFNGPLDNPALDILALRPNLAQKVGVQVTGTALLPSVRLYAEPELPEAEKLAWLVLGRSGGDGGAEAAVLQQAALALLGNRSGINRTGLAESLGLDELSVRGASNTGTGAGSGSGATGGTIAFGKRLSNNFYAVYESSLSGALGTLYLFYELSQRFTVRAQTGAQTAVDLIFTVPYD